MVNKEKTPSASEPAKNILSRLRSRPLYERRILSFAVFIIAAAVVFYLWAGQMYNRFGIAFLGEIKTANVRLENPSETIAPAEENGLRSPLETARDNLIFLKKNFTALISALQLVGGRIGPDNGFEESFSADSDIKKEPPILVNSPSESVDDKANVAGVADPADNGESETAVLSDERPPRRGVISLARSIIMTNIQSITQAFGDFFNYLTQ